MVDLQIKLPDNFLEEETKCDYFISKSIKEVWAVELDLLYEFDRVCKKHNIKYWLDSGTLLGAIRHKGFIPWDDDVDVVLFREDFDKLCKLADEFKHPYFFQTEETDPLCYRSHAQLRNSETTDILNYEYGLDLPFNQGIFLDVFQMDYIPDDDNECKKYLNKINSLTFRFRILRRLTTHYRHDKGIKGVFTAIAHFLLKPFGKQWLRKVYYKREKLMTKYKGTKRAMKLNFSPTYIATKFDVSLFDKTIYVPFENLTLPVPSEYDEVLRRFYGEWHEFKKGINFHSGTVADANMSYKEYIAKNYNK